MSVIPEDREPKDVLHYFEEIAAIPHGSGNTKGISDYIVNFAKSHHLRYVQDKLNNCIVYREASAGCGDAPVMILQGHMDMVCEKNADVSIDMEKEPIRLVLDADGDTLRAEGTTLGADDGAAVAMMLAVLADDTLVHPALECVFTVDEETGMYGAEGLDCTKLSGRRLLNLDSEDEGLITAGCAGGAMVEVAFPEKEDDRKVRSGLRAKLLIDGLRGGHSGEMIGLGRASANVLLGRILYAVHQKNPFRIAAVNGGTKDNAIPRSAEAELLFPEDTDAAALKRGIEELAEAIRKEYRDTDPDIQIRIQFSGRGKKEVLRRKTAENLMLFLAAFPQGVMEYTSQDHTSPQTSLNMGVLKTDADGVTAVFLLRSSINSQKRALENHLSALAQVSGADVKELSAYPAWEFVPKSQFRDTCVRIYKELTGKKARVLVIHGGVECGLLADRMPGLDAVSIGPNIRDIHTPAEHISIASIARTYDYVKAILKAESGEAAE